MSRDNTTKDVNNKIHSAILLAFSIFRKNARTSVSMIEKSHGEGHFYYEEMKGEICVIDSGCLFICDMSSNGRPD